MLPTCTELLRRFAAGEATPGAVLDQVLATIDARDPELGAFVSVDRDGARRAAREADALWRSGRAGPLCGLPVAVKDIIDLAGQPTGCGSPHPRSPAERDAAVVRGLRRAGAVILGKVQLHEYALGITGENPWLGTPRNPCDPTRLPGGSSSGSAVAVAAGMAPLSVGTDTGGSARVPAALCGVVGFKPTFGRLDREGVFPLASTMDHVGLLAREVADLELVFPLLASSLPVRESARRPARGAVLMQLLERAAPDVREAVERALAGLERRGLLRCEAVDLPLLPEAGTVYRTILAAEAATVHREALARGAGFGDDVRAMLELGVALPATAYVAAQRRRALFAAACDELLERHDALVCPTTLVTAPAVGAREVVLHGEATPVREALVSCTCPFSMVGLPALSLPCGTGEGGLPVGLQLAGGRGRDAALLALGEALALDLPSMTPVSR